MIIKLQRPLASSVADPMWLAYDYRQTQVHHIVEERIPPAVRAAMGADAKGYFEAMVDEGRLEIGRRVEDQTW